jgi:hypothetical protein
MSDIMKYYNKALKCKNEGSHAILCEYCEYISFCEYKTIILNNDFNYSKIVPSKIYVKF